MQKQKVSGTVRIAAMLSIAMAAFACERPSRAPAVPADAGLLLGLSSGRTVLLVRRDSGFELAAERRPLLVPHDTGFYWVGTVARCVIDTTHATRIGGRQLVNREERVYSVRPGDTAVVDVNGADCRETERAARQIAVLRDTTITAAARSVAVDSLGAQRTDGVEEVDPESYCSVDKREITFASPSLLTYLIRERSRDVCGPTRSESSGLGRNVARLLTSDSRVAMRSIVSPTSWPEVIKQLADTGGVDCGAAESSADSSWAVRHMDGQWIATVWVTGPGCRVGRDHDIAAHLPDSLVASPPLQVPWQELRAQMPKLYDAAASPSQRYILLARLDSIGIAPVVAGKVLAPVLQIPSRLDERIVMLRWVDVTEAERLRVRMKSLPGPEMTFRGAVKP